MRSLAVMQVLSSSDWLVVSFAVYQPRTLTTTCPSYSTDKSAAASEGQRAVTATVTTRRRCSSTDHYPMDFKQFTSSPMVTSPTCPSKCIPEPELTPIRTTIVPSLGSPNRTFNPLTTDCVTSAFPAAATMIYLHFSTYCRSVIIVYRLYRLK
jgi:hypothetical protein